MVACFLRARRSEHHVFRSAILSLILTLALGPTSALLCHAWCDSHQATASECHHKAPATHPTAAGQDTCNTAVLSAAFLPENTQDGAFSPYDGHPVPVLQYQLTSPTTQAHPGDDTTRAWSCDGRPLSIALRL